MSRNFWFYSNRPWPSYGYKLWAKTFSQNFGYKIYILVNLFLILWHFWFISHWISIIASTHSWNLLLIIKKFCLFIFIYLFFSWQDLWTLEMCGDPKRTPRCQIWSCFVLISKFLFFPPKKFTIQPTLEKQSKSYPYGIQILLRQEKMLDFLALFPKM